MSNGRYSQFQPENSCLTLFDKCRNVFRNGMFIPTKDISTGPVKLVKNIYPDKNKAKTKATTLIYIKLHSTDTLLYSYLKVKFSIIA